MVKAVSYDNNGMKKGAWSKEEDDMLRTFVLRYGHRNWHELPKFAGLPRCGKSCRLRWINYLRPNIKRGRYTLEEDELIMKLYKEHGTKWSLMAKKLPGRTDNEIKNHWHTKLKKLVVEKPPPTKASENEDSNTMKKKQSISVGSCASNIVCHQILESSVFYPEASTSKLSSYSLQCERSPVSENNMNGDSSLKNVYQDFWMEPFVPDNASASPGNLSSWMGGESAEFPYENYEYLDFDLQQLYDNY